MGIIRSRERIFNELNISLNNIESDSILFLTDISNIGFLPLVKSRKEQLLIYFNLLLESTEKRTLLFTTYNYDYCQKGIYNVLEDKCQVGVLNEFIREENPHLRTRTPVFNYCIYSNKNNKYSFEPVENVFSKSSTYGELVSNKATIALLGKFISFLGHHVEEIMDVSYRYTKYFPGKIIYGKDTKKITISYRVRPQINGAVVVDTEKIYMDLINMKLLLQYPIGHNHIYIYRADKVFDFWCDKVKKDEHYFLTESSKQVLEKIYEIYGKPLQYESIEGIHKLYIEKIN
jgi:aminoglycoside N3'-acetyltransferase